jgi:hypothetical protein
MQNIDEIELRSEEVNEILTSVPKSIFLWGQSVIFILLIIFIVLSYFIKYPDILKAEISLTTLNPPAQLKAKRNALIVDIFVNDKDSIKTGQPICLFENTATYNDIIYIDDVVSRLFNFSNIPDSLVNFTLKEKLNLGEITIEYSLVVKALKDLKFNYETNSVQKQIKICRIDLDRINELINQYNVQDIIVSEQLEIVKFDFIRNKKLHKEGAITTYEFELKRKEYLAAMSNSSNAKVNISNSIIQKNFTEKKILELTIQGNQELEDINLNFLKAINSLNAKIKEWKSHNLLLSPIHGRVSFSSIIANNQTVNLGDELFTIIPYQKNILIGKCILSSINSGKVKVGQTVNIKIDNYPYQQNGLLLGEIINISDISINNNYVLDVKLINGLNSTYNKELIYKNGMKGTAEIITENLSILDRLFFQFKSILKFN